MKISRILLNGVNFLVYSNILLAFCAVAYTAKTSLILYGNNGSWHVNILVFCATLLFYCFHRINKKKLFIPNENLEARNNWMETHKNSCYLLIGASLVILIWQLFYMPIRTWFIFMPMALVALGYTFPIIPTKSGFKSLRNIYWLKTFWVAFVFSWLSTFLPVVYIESLSAMLKRGALFIFFRALLFLFAACIPFDIRDMYFDKQRGANTLPVRVGAKASVYLAIILLLVFILLLNIDFIWFGLNLRLTLALLLSAVITIFSLPFAKSKRPALVFPLLYDGAMLIQWLLVFVLIGW